MDIQDKSPEGRKDDDEGHIIFAILPIVGIIALLAIATILNNVLPHNQPEPQRQEVPMKPPQSDFKEH